MDGIRIFLVLLLAYLSLLVGVGWYHTKRQGSPTDFWLAGRQVGATAIGFSAAASWLTAGAMLAVVGFFMLSGMGSIWGFVAPNILALLIIAIFVKKIKNLPSITQPELLEQRYGSVVRAPVAVIITIVMILFAVADIKGFAFVLQVFYGLSPVYAAMFVALAVGLYVTLGGLAAVIWTDFIQYVLLAVFTLAMAFFAVQAAMTGLQTPHVSVSDLLTDVPTSWWNPLSIGLPMALIFILAIIPGWISEQDPWQRIWAARDEIAAARSMIIGSLLITLVFAACAIIAIALNAVYPEISKMGFPAGMAQAEPALLNFIKGRFSSFAIALCAIGLAAAAMSCADTFATSGASCLARDIYQRYFKPDATMRQMLIANRISVLLIVLAATLASFFIDNIIDAIHIATFIASSCYFFPLMGGLYWKRATTEGAMAGIVTGAVVQVALIAVDLAGTQPMMPPYLESLSFFLTGHGVVLGMVSSGAAFVGVSLMTKPSSVVNLAPFFREESQKLIGIDSDAIDESGQAYLEFIHALRESVIGRRTQLQLNLQAGEKIDWFGFLKSLKGSYGGWVTPTGMDAAYRLTNSDMLSCVSVVRGNGDGEICFKAEPRIDSVGTRKKELFTAYRQVCEVLKNNGFSV